MSIQAPMSSEMLSNIAQKAGRVAVLYGGTSSEREISLKSGKAIIAALESQGVNVFPVDIQLNAIEQIQSVKPDVAFIALHGPGGEDGRMQALLEFLNIPYTGSGVAASALCMDKVRTKQLWCGIGLPTPDYRTVKAGDDWGRVFELGTDLIVKPSHEGSSFGVARVNSLEQLKEAYEAASQLDPEVLVERFVQGNEYTVAILGGKALPPIQLVSQNSFYDFEAKYELSSTQYLCPCDLSNEQSEKLQSLALKAFKAVGAQGWGRVDVMSEGDDFYLLEVNTVPGMTNTSLVPMAAKVEGYSFEQLVMKVLQLALNS